jgi:hypothetical protein
MSGFSIFTEGVFRPLHRLEVGKVYHILGIQQIDTCCFALLVNGPEKLVTELRPEDLEILPTDRTQIKNLRVLHSTRFGEPVVQFRMWDEPMFTMC